jgi:SAM-dependent methyltransferase
MAARYLSDLMAPVMDGARLLVTGAGDGVALQLCEGEAHWHSAVADDEGAQLFRKRYGEASKHVEGAHLPFEDGFFDLVVVYDYLEYQTDPQALFMECHRVLKENGRVVVHVPRAKRWAVARGLQRALGLPGPKAVGAKPYTATQLFEVIKDGFDVEDERTYGRFFLEMTESLAVFMSEVAVGGMRRRARQLGMEEENDAVAERRQRVRACGYPFHVLANLLDKALFFTTGYYMVFRGRRRHRWAPRRTPVLKDGRSIADATINTKIGTAGPFEGGST